ncbi:hypothetical protein [Actinomadura roseirufa]|nr:hypothetical protein [Actinomadura roseirufa]
MKRHFAHVTKQIKAADTIPALLTSAFIGLEQIERAVRLLAESAPEGT